MGIEAALRRRATSSDIALVHGEVSWTFAQLFEQASHWAEILAARGVGKGDRVLLHTTKQLDAVAALYGIWQAGAVAVPMAPDTRARGRAHLSEHSGASHIVTEERYRDLWPDALLLEHRSEYSRTPVERGTAASDDPAAGLAILLYTSGSTGRPKGIAITHHNLIAGARIVSGYLGLRPEDRILSVLPLHFDYGLNQLLCAVETGSTLVLQRSSHPGRIVQTLIDAEISVLAGVPPLWHLLLQQGSPIAKAPLRVLTNSGGAFPAKLLATTQLVLPESALVLMYGLTEAFRSTYLPPGELWSRGPILGRAIPETDIDVVDAEGRRCPPGVEGELIHRGPTVARGYHDDPEATARVFREDPLGRGGTVVFSGDTVWCDEDGYFTYVGRRDQQLKCFAQRVCPEEIEQVLLTHPRVEDAVVGGVPNEVAGTRVVAHVVAAPLDEEALLDWCREVLPPHEQPLTIVVHRAFPTTSSGKTDRAAVLKTPVPAPRVPGFH
jgi:amino acid adenylation domain-containing protein